MALYLCINFCSIHSQKRSINFSWESKSLIFLACNTNKLGFVLNYTVLWSIKWTGKRLKVAKITKKMSMIRKGKNGCTFLLGLLQALELRSIKTRGLKIYLAMKWYSVQNSTLKLLFHAFMKRIFFKFGNMF